MVEPLEIAGLLDLLTESLWRAGKARSDEALETAQRAVALKSESVGDTDPRVAVSLNNLGQIYRKRGRLDAARAEFERALAIQNGSLDADDPERARTLNSLGMTLRAAGDLGGARAFYEEALEIRTTALGADHIRTAETRNNLANLLRDEGQTGEARVHMEAVLKVMARELGPTHPTVATVMNNLGLLLMDMAEYAEARRLYERSLEIRRAELGTDHGDVAQSLNNLAILFQRIGDSEGARRRYEEALEIRVRTLGPDHMLVALVQSNLSFLLSRMGEPEEAQKLIDQALAIREKRLGPDHWYIADSLNTIGHLQRTRGETDAALASIERALAIQRASFEEPHHKIGLTIWSLGATYRAAGRLEEARQAFEETLEIWRQTLGPDHPRIAEVLDDLAGIQWLQGEPAAAVERALAAEGIARAHVQRTARGQSERDALGYEAFRVGGRDVALLALTSGADISTALRLRAWDELIRSRALVLDEMATRNRLMHGSTDPETVRLARKLERSRNRLAKLLASGPDRRRPDEYPARLASALEETEAAERQLAAHSLPFRQQRARKRVGRESVVAALPANSCLISYFLFQKLKEKAEQDENGSAGPSQVATYAALVQLPGKAAPIGVSLGPAEKIDALVARWRESVATPPPALPAAARSAEHRYLETALALRRAIWDPVAAIIGEAEQVFLVPDGDLHVVSLATLPSPGSGYLAEDGPRFHYLAAERDLAPRTDDWAPGSGILALGGPDFDLGDGGAEARRGEAGAACRDLSSLHFDALPAAAREAREIAALWSEGEPSEARDVRVLTGAAAAEGAFKELAPGRRLLHLATHGFFLDDCASASSPLLLSGIGLTGANSSTASPSGDQEDGILSALEIASLDLRGVEWAVLSACETGLGKVQRGEGVLGLRRAFEVAGVRTLIMSLWAVQDEATREWMTGLYRGRRDGLPTVEAVQRASLERIAARKEAGRGTHPFYWGAFVAVGDWR